MLPVLNEKLPPLPLRGKVGIRLPIWYFQLSAQLTFRFPDLCLLASDLLLSSFSPLAKGMSEKSGTDSPGDLGIPLGLHGLETN